MFSDWTVEEKERLFGLKNMPHPEIVQVAKKVTTKLLSSSVPNAFNHCDIGRCTAVKNQGVCGSCWAFSAIAAVESAYMLEGNKLMEMSEQELVDCSSSVGNNGC